MPTVEGAGVPLHVEEQGTGPAVLLIHGLASDALALDPVAAAIAAGGAWAIAYDRRGYGTSGAPEPYHGTTVEEQAEDAAALLRALDPGPAVVAGDGLGALVALDLVKRHGGLVRAAVLSNPVLFALVPEATEMLSTQRAEIEEAVRAGGLARRARAGGRARPRPRRPPRVLRRLRRPRDLGREPPRAARARHARGRPDGAVVAAPRRGRGRRARRPVAGRDPRGRRRHRHGRGGSAGLSAR